MRIALGKGSRWRAGTTSGGFGNWDDPAGKRRLRVLQTAAVLVVLSAVTAGCASSSTGGSEPDDSIVGSWIDNGGVQFDYRADGTFGVPLEGEDGQEAHRGTYSTASVGGVIELTEECVLCAQQYKESLAEHAEEKQRQDTDLRENYLKITLLTESEYYPGYYHKEDQRYGAEYWIAQGTESVPLLSFTEVGSDPSAPPQEALVSVAEFEAAVSRAIREGKDTGEMMIVMPNATEPVSVRFSISSFEPEPESEAENPGKAVYFVVIDGDSMRAFYRLEDAQKDDGSPAWSATRK